jgi:hypothetical protein
LQNVSARTRTFDSVGGLVLVIARIRDGEEWRSAATEWRMPRLSPRRTLHRRHADKTVIMPPLNPKHPPTRHHKASASWQEKGF